MQKNRYFSVLQILVSRRVDFIVVGGIAGFCAEIQSARSIWTSYAELLTNSIELNVDEGLRVRVLDLKTQIAVKEETGGKKDLAALPILRRTLEESRRQNRS